MAGFPQTQWLVLRLRGKKSEDGQLRNATGEKGFSAQKTAINDKALDAKFGEGTSAIKNQISLGLKGSEQDKAGFNQSFTEGVSSAHSAGGKEGVSQFLSQMESATQGGGTFSEASKSANDIGNNFKSQKPVIKE